MKVVVATRKKKSDKELTRLGAALRGLGGLGGTAIGSLIGAGGAGGGIGRQIGAGLSRWLGSGDYELSQNSLLESAGSSIPMMHKDGQSIVVRHKEFLGEISGSTGFTVQQTYNVNPGLANTFPWLAAIAAKFQEYRILGMVFHYVPTSGTAVGSTSTALGSVMIQSSYRAGDAAPTTKMEMLNEYWSSEITPYESGCHPLECDPRENPYNLHYVRTGILPSGSDQLLYDLATTYVATSGMQSTAVVGDLWVTYEVELKKPMLTSAVLDPTSGFSAYTTTAISSSSMFGTTVTYGNGTLNERITLVGNTVTIDRSLAGWFYVYISVQPATTFSYVQSATLTVTGATQALVTRTATLQTMNAGTNGSYSNYVVEFAIFKADTTVPAVVTLTPTFNGSVTSSSATIYHRNAPYWT